MFILHWHIYCSDNIYKGLAIFLISVFMPYDICKSITTTVDRQTYKFLKGDLTYHYTTKLVDIPRRLDVLSPYQKWKLYPYTTDAHK